MKTAAQRARKRQQRENRDNKGVSTAAKIQARNALIRDSRSRMGGWRTADEAMMLLAASMIGRR